MPLAFTSTFGWFKNSGNKLPFYDKLTNRDCVGAWAAKGEISLDSWTLDWCELSDNHYTPDGQLSDWSALKL